MISYVLKITFESFNVEADDDCRYDFLNIMFDALGDGAEPDKYVRKSLLLHARCKHNGRVALASASFIYLYSVLKVPLQSFADKSLCLPYFVFVPLLPKHKHAAFM